MSLLKDETLMATGDTGSFGDAVLNRFLKTDIGRTCTFSHNEKEQDDMRHEFQTKIPEIADRTSFYTGDVRDIQSIKSTIYGIGYIFHTAALKQIPSCEFFPIKTVKTNILGTENVLIAAIDDSIETVICLSTDKTAYSVNAMGTSKTMVGKVIVAKSRMISKTKICYTRYGNVMCSCGSIIPLWIERIRKGNAIALTDPGMTHFIMFLDDVVSLVLFAFEHGEGGDILVQRTSACMIGIQAETVCDLFGGKKEDIKTIGIRHDEKMYEALLTNEECTHTIDMGNFYRVPCDKHDLNYDRCLIHGDTEWNTLAELNSNNMDLLSVE